MTDYEKGIRDGIAFAQSHTFAYSRPPGGGEFEEKIVPWVNTSKDKEFRERLAQQYSAIVAAAIKELVKS